MMLLSELFGKTTAELQAYLNEGWLRVQYHPTEGLAILNYTERTAFAKHWDAVTLNCRGLIYDISTEEVIARPFPKFFNSTEENAPKFELDDKVVVTDKMDGSLGILYPEGKDRYAIATRGSFASEQAKHATALLRTKYADWYAGLLDEETAPDPRLTLLFEIVYPSNRIVLDYGDTDDLVVIGMVDIESGEIYPAKSAVNEFKWPGPMTYSFGEMTYAEAIAMPPRENAEGIVLLDWRDDRMVKLKQEDYVRLHRIITGLNARSVWQHMQENDYTTDGLKESLPEEFWPWVDGVADHLVTWQADLWNEIENEYFKRVVVGGDRGQCARAFAGYEHAWALFAFLDEDYGKIREGIWKRIKPEADWGPNDRGEATSVE